MEDCKHREGNGLSSCYGITKGICKIVWDAQQPEINKLKAEIAELEETVARYYKAMHRQKEEKEYWMKKYEEGQEIEKEN